MSRPFGPPEELERRRRQAVRVVRQGESPEAVARALGIDRSSIYRWLRLADQPGGLAARPHPGPAPRLAAEQQHQLLDLLRQGADAHGWSNRLWTLPRVAELIRRHFGIRLQHDHVGRFLRGQLRWTPQKPAERARERRPGAIRYWQEVRLPALLRDSQERGAYVVWLDESGFQLNPAVRRTWAPRGQTPILERWDRRDRLSVISSVTVSPRAGRLNLYFDVLADNANARASDSIAFLQALRRQVRAPLTVIWDGSNIHSKSKAVQAYLAAHPDIVVATLPGYAPELNPTEQVWNWTKNARLPNLAAEDTDELREAVITELLGLRREPQKLQSFLEHSGVLLPA
jgi:transposase